MFVCVSLFILSSCESKSGHRSTTPATTVKAEKSVEIKLMSGSDLDNSLLRPLDGTANVQNSMKTVAYPWHTGWKAEYEKLSMVKNPGLPSPEQKVAAYQINNAETMKDVFYSLPMDNEWKWLTQSQVVEFCLSNRNFIKNSKKDIVFFCKRDESKILYERNLTEELVAIIVVPELGGETRMMLGIMGHDSPIGGCTVIFPKNEIRIVKY
ncbi:MAG: hypothetical protein WC249_04330 [Patescibacteria group bacterium]